MNLSCALDSLAERLDRMTMPDAARVSITREIEFFKAQLKLEPGAVAHASDLRWHYLILLSRARGTPVLQYLLDHEEVFDALEKFALASETGARSFRMKKVDELEVHELFLHLAEKVAKTRRESSRGLTELFFDLKTLQGQAMETKYRRNKADIRYAWSRVKQFSESEALFADFKGARILREKLKAFLDF